MSELPERDPSRPAHLQGLFRKFEVERVDGRHPDCTYFVLDLDCDPHAKAALEAYIESCRKTHTKLAEDLTALLTADPRWQPKGTMTMGESIEGAMTFSEALNLIVGGSLLRRRGWNGRGMFVFLVPGSTFNVNREPLSGIYPEGTEINYHAHIDMKMADGRIMPWTPSQADILSADWELAE